MANKTILIAEIGSNHLGDLEKAKELIRAAHQSGADLVKSQAYIARDIKSGSMPKEFYQMCEFTFEEYIELIEYAKSIGTTLFYSIFSKCHEPLSYHQEWHKIAGAQTQLGFNFVEKKDTDRTIVSVPALSKRPNLKKSRVLHVSGYLTAHPSLENIDHLTEYYGRQCGYSDHTIGIETCLKALFDHHAGVIEKHFTVTRDIYFGGNQYRDAVHAAMPNELAQLAKLIEEF